MNRERVMATLAAGVVVVAALAAVLVPGAIADPSADEPVRPGPTRVVDMPIAPGEIGGESATLRVTAQLRHVGNPAPNVSVVFRAVGTQSGLVETARRVPVGELADDGERSVTTNLTVERTGGYRIETIVYSGDDRLDTAARTVSGLGALTPAYARTTVGFTDEAALPPLSVAVEEAGENRTTLRVSPSLTNRGDTPSRALRVELTLRQAESNIVAARTAVDVGTIQAGRTASPATTVAVPARYNYYVDAVLYSDGVVVDTARGAVNLDPSETLSVNETRRQIRFEASDFEGGAGGGSDGGGTQTPVSGGGQPGFGVGAALVALLAAGLLARRWSA
jgi:PGF-CTERM protein